MKQAKNIKDLTKDSREYWLYFKDNAKKVVRVYTRNKLRFFNKVRALTSENFMLGVRLKISYGKKVDNFGKNVEFINEGIYKNKKDFDLAFKAFTEKS